MLEDADIEAILRLLNASTKRELEKFCRAFVLRAEVFASFLRIAMTGGFAPYKYASCFREWSPPDLALRPSDLDALSANGIGPLDRAARKTMNKVWQTMQDRRMLAAHLLYTADYEFWYLFYFDQRDRERHNNHWRHGPHIHLISYHWPGLGCGAVWHDIHQGNANFPNKIHLRYQER